MQRRREGTNGTSVNRLRFITKVTSSPSSTTHINVHSDPLSAHHGRWRYRRTIASGFRLIGSHSPVRYGSPSVGATEHAHKQTSLAGISRGTTRCCHL